MRIKRYICTGRAAGSDRYHQGGAANTLCLPLKPEWGVKKDGQQGANAYVYGAEYETYDKKLPFHQNVNYEIPCAVCRTMGRPNVLMIPGKM